MVYNKDEKFIFISYAHKDGPKVSRYIDALVKNDFSVWYDAGIEAGTEWPEYIEEHLKKAAAVIVFMTPNAVASRNCRNEINFALDLGKDVLVVYLEDTELLKGMRLQLNSTQSLFRKNHVSDESFVSELINARMLQCCRSGGVSDEYEAPEIVETNNQNITRVASINAIGTNKPDDYWPEGMYSQTINRDEFHIVCFHINLLKTFGFSGTIENRYQVFNSDNNPIYDDVTTLFVEPDYDKISFSWILKGDDGSVVPEGDYRFTCSINNSPEFSYHFTVTCNEDEITDAPRKKSFLSKLKKLFEN